MALFVRRSIARSVRVGMGTREGVGAGVDEAVKKQVCGGYVTPLLRSAMCPGVGCSGIVCQGQWSHARAEGLASPYWHSVTHVQTLKAMPGMGMHPVAVTFLRWPFRSLNP